LICHLQKVKFCVGGTESGRRNSGGSTGIHSRVDSVTDSLSSSQNSSQDNSRAYQSNVSRFSSRPPPSPPQSVNPRPISQYYPSHGISRGPMRSRSSDRLYTPKTGPTSTSDASASYPRVHSEKEKNFHDQIRTRTLELRRNRDSKIDTTNQNRPNQRPRSGSFNNSEAGKFRVTDHLINSERFGSLSRLTARRKYHSPGTVSCQDFHQAPTPIIAKPFLTPGQQSNEVRRAPSGVNRRINYDSTTHLSGPSISRSKVI